jgi:hypothetical protein
MAFSYCVISGVRKIMHQNNPERDEDSTKVISSNGAAGTRRSRCASSTKLKFRKMSFRGRQLYFMVGGARNHLKIEQRDPAKALCNRRASSHPRHKILTTHPFAAAVKRAAPCLFCNSDGTRFAVLHPGRVHECRRMEGGKMLRRMPDLVGT